MSVHYYCRHCGYKIGEISNSTVPVESLGFQHLSVHEQKEMITYTAAGDIEVKTICEHCEDALHHNPNFHELRTFIQ